MTRNARLSDRSRRPPTSSTSVIMPENDMSIPKWARDTHKVASQIYEPLYKAHSKAFKQLKKLKESTPRHKKAEAYLEKSLDMSRNLLSHLENGW